MPRAGTHTLAGPCALWLPSAASSSGNLRRPAKPHPPQTTCPTPPQPPVQAPQHLLSTAEAAFDLAAVLPHGKFGACHPLIGRAWCAVVAECCILLWKSPHTGKPATPTNHLPSPAAASSAGSTTSAEQARDWNRPRKFACIIFLYHVYCRRKSSGGCPCVWISPQNNIKTTTPTNHLPGPAAAPSTSPTTPAEHCRCCI